jgi:hypothetical protein
MRRFLIAAALGLALLPTRTAPAAPFTSAFETLQSELETRRDNDFGGVLDATQKKQQKAVLKSLVLIGRTSDSALDDMKTISSVARTLERAYPVDMAFGSPSALGTDSFAALQDLYNLFVADYGPFGATVVKMAPSAAYRKAAKSFKVAQKALASVGPDSSLSGAARAYLKAWKAVLKGIPAAAAGTLLPAPGVDYTADGTAVSTQVVSWTYHSVSRVIEIACSSYDPGTGDSHDLYFTGTLDASGPALAFTGGQYNRNIGGDNPEYFEIIGGTVTITTADIPGHRIEGSFDLTATDVFDFGISGTFLATWNLEIVKD